MLWFLTFIESTRLWYLTTAPSPLVPRRSVVCWIVFDQSCKLFFCVQIATNLIDLLVTACLYILVRQIKSTRKKDLTSVQKVITLENVVNEVWFTVDIKTDGPEHLCKSVRDDGATGFIHANAVNFGSWIKLVKLCMKKNQTVWHLLCHIWTELWLSL